MLRAFAAGQLNVRLLVLALVLLAVPMGSAKAVDGFDLEQWCNADHKMSTGFCLGYVNAVAGILSRQRVGEHCAALVGKDSLSSKQLVEIVKVFLIKQPQIRSVTGTEIVAAAMAEAFPCKKRN